MATVGGGPEHYSAARVRTTARSVSAWTWERRDAFTGGHRDVDAAAQAWMGRRSAEAHWEAHADRDAEIVRLSLGGYSQRVIARSVGVSQSAVHRVLTRMEEAHDGVPELRMDAPELVAEDQEPEDQEAEAETVDMEPDTLDETPVGAQGLLNLDSSMDGGWAISSGSSPPWPPPSGGLFNRPRGRQCPGE